MTGTCLASLVLCAGSFTFFVCCLLEEVHFGEQRFEWIQCCCLEHLLLVEADNLSSDFPRNHIGLGDNCLAEGDSPTVPCRIRPRSDKNPRFFWPFRYVPFMVVFGHSGFARSQSGLLLPQTASFSLATDLPCESRSEPLEHSGSALHEGL